jgi:hypothetical protein
MGRKFWGKSLAQGEGGPKGRVRGEEKNLCTPHQVPINRCSAPSPFGRGNCPKSLPIL